MQGEEVQFGVVEHRSGYSRPMTRRRRVVDPDDYFDLGENVCGGGGVGDNEVDGPHTLAVPEKRGKIRERERWAVVRGITCPCSWRSFE